MLVSLMYYSSLTSGVSADAIACIFKSAQRKNTDMGISGILYSDGKKFLQVLEGSRHEVSRVFSAIQKDERHHDIVVVACSEIAEREYGEWSMGLLRPDPAVKEILREEIGSEALDPWEMSHGQIRSLLNRLADERLRQLIPRFRMPA